MKALHFGAGNIGKGLIGYLLNKSGFEICFVDANEYTVNSMNRSNSYFFELLDEDHTAEIISPVRALHSSSQEQVINEIVEADLITTSVGVDNLSKIAPVLSKGLLKRIQLGRRNIDIIANENMINASSKLKEEIQRNIPNSDMETICKHVGFPNSAIDRLSLSEERSEGVVTLVEPYYEWMIEKPGLLNSDLPSINNATYVAELKPYIERKLYIVNMGHAATAYTAFLEGYTTIQSALMNPEIEKFLRETLKESASYFTQIYNFEDAEIIGFIDQTIKRFKNDNISDDILRVGRSPIRKLGFDERLIKPTRVLFELGLPTEKLTTAVATAFLFHNTHDEESVTIQSYIREQGIEQAIDHFTGLEDATLKRKIKDKYIRLKENYSSKS
ncbi:mannitol-1-phosphate 5-dehydrogenase [Halobacillus andaensis]|uniref:Mannitol-1-phosphate 5-dehydrogenase n=1 Tax=Halobacillus andaensis TaxID=1176239 RepID=A0A917EWT0_HALAA|nr:mannitol-1-phosphate 5-dehydrogenase [Halobacillus andaensis]MBP2006513.1 mannitol-1-phosphate 5-dehydrogenase [Halobacillus andaensis]GGF27970.1 mannitol-1-phosphate 5-dehydrogenase [Halobacillus andaensis]